MFDSIISLTIFNWLSDASVLIQYLFQSSVCKNSEVLDIYLFVSSNRFGATTLNHFDLIDSENATTDEAILCVPPHIHELNRLTYHKSSIQFIIHSKP
ncbi:MAG: hypothetical protein Q8S84_07105 [bacterium]|nr:hypothetical protein [bacterium]MDP3381224.1 hypothetical protein [bacterium]